MTHVPPLSSAAQHRGAPLLDHERLEVYQLALRFHSEAMRLVPARGFRRLKDQLERSSLSIVLNTAEGAGRRSATDKQRFYAIARGSATESAAVIDVLRIRGIASVSRCGQAHRQAVRLVQMLSRLCSPRS